MPKKEPHRRTLTPPLSQWEKTLEEADQIDRAQAGEIEPGDEDGGGGDKGFDSDTGDGGYGGDAALAGYDEADAQPDRPLDREIQGDPRTHEGESYPDEAKALDPHQSPLRKVSLDEEGENDAQLR